MRNIYVKMAGMAAAALIGTSAWAGFKSATEVNVSGNSAYGSLASARNSADGVQYIGCHLYTYNTGSASVACYATSASGVQGSCSSTNALIVDAVRSMNGDSYILFRWDTAGACTYLVVSNASQYAPKQP